MAPKEEKMKVTAIFGSPRKANSEFLAEHFLKTLEDNGAAVTRWHLPNMDYSGCKVCAACKNGQEKCVVKDDLTPLLESMNETDVLVLATPLYYFDASSRVRAMIERWYSFLLPMYYTGENRQTRLPEGKQIVLVVSQGAPVEQFQDFPQRMESIFQLYNFRPAHLLRSGFGNDPKAAENNKTLLAEAEQTAKLVMDRQNPIAPITPYHGGI